MSNPSKTYEFGELGKKAKENALAQYLKKSLVLEKHSRRLTNSNIKNIAESHLLYSKDTIHERFKKNGDYLGLFNIHEDSVDLDY